MKVCQCIAIILLFFAVSLLSLAEITAGTLCLPQTGQQACYSGSGDAIPCPKTGQDGETMAGIGWPSPRFKDNGDTITDLLTGLMWAKDADLQGGQKTWEEALRYIEYMNKDAIFGYKDWRLPNINELKSLINDGQTNNASWLNSQGFENVRNLFYWSSTTYAADTGRAWILYMEGGIIGALNKGGNAYVLPVRDAEKSGTITLPMTGQGVSYIKGDDGDLKKGSAWPSTRFAEKGECILDNLTGLLWAKNANLTGEPLTWQEALDQARKLSLCGYNDWRLPNINELRSLMNYGEADIPGWLRGQGFQNVQNFYYWSSTSYALDPATAKVVHMSHSGMRFGFKKVKGYFWPVRGGCGSQD